MSDSKPYYEITFNNATPLCEYIGSLKDKLIVVKNDIYYVVDPNDVTSDNSE